MKSSTGKYYIALDHVRALAILLVFIWHFIHVQNGYKAPPTFLPLSLLTEGHTGVAIFMTLSGYLFAKLLAGKRIKYKSFFYNRFLRLAPLLFLVIFLVGLQRYLYGLELNSYLGKIAKGFLFPTLPNGGWSIVVEFHFYLLLPTLLFFKARWQHSLLLVLLGAIMLRVVLYLYLGGIQDFSYYTIGGRIDQFLLGIIAYQYRASIANKHVLFATAASVFLVFFWYFDLLGGFYMNSSYPSPSPIWIFMPTIEGLIYGLGIAWYENSFQHSSGRISRFIALIGTYSYSIYLLHFFVVSKLAITIDRYIINLAYPPLAVAFGVCCFSIMIPVGFFSFRFIESPFLNFRVKYIISDRRQKIASQDGFSGTTKTSEWTPSHCTVSRSRHRGND